MVSGLSPPRLKTKHLLFRVSQYKYREIKYLAKISVMFRAKGSIWRVSFKLTRRHNANHLSRP